MIGIALRDLSVDLDDAAIIKHLDLVVPASAWLGVIGPNGAGKTTLIRAIIGAVKSKGEVLLGDERVADLDRRALSRLIAYVPQLPYIPRAMTVTDYVLMGRTPYIPYFGIETAQDLNVVEEVLERLDLIAFANRALGSLSGGELQRVVLGRALAQRAPILVLDEPTSSLDVGHQQRVLELIDALRKEDRLTVISALHDLTLAGQFTDQLVLLHQGRIVAQGDPDEVLTAEAIRTHYGATVKVVRDNGTVLIVPTRMGT